MELVSRIGDIADAMSKCRSRNLPEEQRELYVFAETITLNDRKQNGKNILCV